MRRAQNMVKDFHKAMGLPVRSETVDVYADTELELRSALIVEEVQETITALRNSDLIKIADGLADTMYVAAGTALTFGVDVDTYRMAGCRRAIASAMEDIGQALRRPDKERLGVALKHLEVVVKGMAYDFEVPLLAVFEEVHRSNMTKMAHPHTAGCGIDAGDRCDCGAIIYADNGKVLKPATYEPPDIASVMRRG